MTKKNAYYLIITAVLFFLQVSLLLAHVRAWGIYFNLPLLFVIILAFKEGPKQGFLWGLWFGLLLSITSYSGWFNFILLAALGYIAGLLPVGQFRRDAAVLIIVVVIITLLWAIIYNLYFAVLYSDLLHFPFFKIISFVLMHAIMTPIMQRLVNVKENKIK